MDNYGGSKGCAPADLVGQKAAWLLWYLPIVLLVAGLNWNRGRVWLWIPAFAVMGVGCLVNAVRCQRIHCYFTGPLFLLATVFVALSALGVVKLFLLIVLGASCVAICAEIPLGKYRKRAQCF